MWPTVAQWLAVAVVLFGTAGISLAQPEHGVSKTAETPKAMATTADPAFEVATIKPSAADWNSSGFHNGGRRVWCDNQSVGSIMQYAYGVSDSQIVGGPEWLASAFYVVDGVPDATGVPNEKQSLGMYQKLLADRFKLTFHHEKRDLPVLAIRVGKSGAKLAKSQGDPNGLPDETGNGDRNGVTVRYTNVSMEQLAANLQTMMNGRPVVDETGLIGRFDFTLKWTMDEAPTSDPNAAPGLFTAIQEQLGLKLEGTRAQADVIVIDHVERPSAN